MDGGEVVMAHLKAWMSSKAVMKTGDYLAVDESSQRGANGAIKAQKQMGIK
jgi:hypothetical protein